MLRAMATAYRIYICMYVYNLVAMLGGDGHYLKVLVDMNGK